MGSVSSRLPPVIQMMTRSSWVSNEVHRFIFYKPSLDIVLVLYMYFGCFVLHIYICRQTVGKFLVACSYTQVSNTGPLGLFHISLRHLCMGSYHSNERRLLDLNSDVIIEHVISDIYTLVYRCIWLLHGYFW